MYLVLPGLLRKRCELYILTLICQTIFGDSKFEHEREEKAEEELRKQALQTQATGYREPVSITTPPVYCVPRYPPAPIYHDQARPVSYPLSAPTSYYQKNVPPPYTVPGYRILPTTPTHYYLAPGNGATTYCPTYPIHAPPPSHPTYHTSHAPGPAYRTPTYAVPANLASTYPSNRGSTSPSGTSCDQPRQ